MFGRDVARDDENARADDGADADHGEMHRPQRAVKLNFFSQYRIGDRTVRRSRYSASAGLSYRGAAWRAVTV